MSKRWQPSVKLITTGIIISDLHFGPFLRDWWYIRMTLQENGIRAEQYYPFRVGMKTQVEIKNRPFIIRVVQGNKHNNSLPGFLCESLLESNEEVENDLTSAISKLYKKIFQNETRFSGTLMMGMENESILNELVSDLNFRPFSINTLKFNILIHSIGENGFEFASSLFYSKSKERALFFQTMNDNEYSICIYKAYQLFEKFQGLDSNDVWKKIGILKDQSGITLFGLDNSIVQEKLEQARRVIEFWTRSPNPESNKAVINMLYHNGFLNIMSKNTADSIEKFWNSFEHSLNLNKRGNNGKQRILSIIVDNFSYEELETKLHVSSHTIHNAKIYGRINGPGCPAISKPPMKRKIMPQEHEDQFEWFMSSKENINLSSYKIHTKTGLPLKYLSNQKETLWEKFHKSFPNGMKRTAFLNRLRNGPFVYQEDLGGLCSTCSTYGYDVFEDLSNLIIQNITDREFQTRLLKKIENFKRFLKRDYPKHLHIMHDGKVVHDSCINRCLPFAFGNCNEAHTSECGDCNRIFDLFTELRSLFGNEHDTTLKELQEMLEYYLAHLTRKGYLNNQFNANLLQLDNNSVLIIVDFKMRILPRRIRETKQDFYAKRGWALHTVLVYSKNQENKELEIQAFDYWSNDNKQDAWFTASSFDATFNLLDPKPKWVIIMSDNGSHYHCSETMALISKWPEWYNIECKKWCFLEAGEAKTSIDSHHAQISHAIKRYVRLGFDLNSGEDIEKALNGLSGTSTAYLKPNRQVRNQSNVKTIPGISNWFEWSWPTEGPFAGYVCARDLPDFGEIKKFSPSKFIKTELLQPEPAVVSNTNNWDLRRWSIEKLNKELTSRNIFFDAKMGRNELMNLLKQEMYEDSRFIEDYNDDFLKMDIDNDQIFHLSCGWALKCNQKYGKKGSGKSAKDMLDGLKEMVENNELTAEAIPSLKTIENWITRFSSQSKKEHAEQFLEQDL
ncbi:hypothetical protein Glove_349g83 [Diversispora epigaea]|uniref:Uncharacterized protein n=1 Tax=Diversispora epigaea TaxID=1348612 RepID=A0A397HDJ4_9GLOM|nr:hypothetical protein Glove_349g83 [Diversispora epigaea]